MNKLMLIGRLGKDPELTYTSSGKPICKFSVATSDGFKDNKKTNWHNVVVFGNQAEPCKEYLHKGSQVCVVGRVDYNSWDGKDGQKHYRTDIVSEQVEFLGSNGSGNTKSTDSTSGDTGSSDTAPDMGDDDIPF